MNFVTIQRFKSVCLLLVTLMCGSSVSPQSFNERMHRLKGDRDFVFIVPMYNNAPWYKMCLSSIFAQEYEKYRVIVIDDCSTDGTADLVEKYVCEKGQQARVTLIRNPRRCMQLANRYNAAHMCADDEVLIMLDGDDFLANSDVLNRLNQAYADPETWLVYGQFIRWCDECKNATLDEKIAGVEGCEHYKGLGWPHRLIPRHLKTVRRVSNRMKTNGGAIHLRTFYAKLFKQIPLRDLLFQGTFFPRSTEVATSYPLTEMAGKHVDFVPEVLMYLNRQNALSCIHVYQTDEMHARFAKRHFSADIRNRTAYESLKSLDIYGKPENKFDCIVVRNEKKCDVGMVEKIRTLVGKNARICIVSPETKCGAVYGFLIKSSAQSLLLIQDLEQLSAQHDLERCLSDFKKAHAQCVLLSISDVETPSLLEAEHVDIAPDSHAVQMSYYPKDVPQPYEHPNIVCRTSQIKASLRGTRGSMSHFMEVWKKRGMHKSDVCIFYS